MNNKKGAQIVEAAVVLPILILTILSLILLLVYYFTCLNDQTGLHEDMLRYVQESEKIFEIYENNTETSKRISGLVHMLMGKESAGSVYVIHHTDFIRAGEMIGIE